ncbi:MAG: hypothetical protein ACK412_07080 [Chloroherpetonaceae bacterium]
MKVKKTAKEKKTTRTKKSLELKEPKTVLVRNGDKVFEIIPAKKSTLTPKQEKKLQADVKKIVERMLNGMSEVEYVERMRGHFK